MGSKSEWGKAVGRVVLRRRAESGMTGAEAAKISGLHISQWRGIEQGREGKLPTLSTIQKVAKAINCSVAEIVADAEAIIRQKEQLCARREASLQSRRELQLLLSGRFRPLPTTI